MIQSSCETTWPTLLPPRTLPRLPQGYRRLRWSGPEHGWQKGLPICGNSAVSLGCGAFFVLAGYLLTADLWALGRLHLTLPLAAGFLAVSPLFANSVISVPLLLDRSDANLFTTSIEAVRSNPAAMLFWAVLFVFLLIRKHTG